MDALTVLSELYGEDLAIAQLKLEAEAYEIGAARFLKAMERKAEHGEAADTNVSRPLIAVQVPLMVDKINQFIEASNTGRAGKKHAALRFLRAVNADRIAFMAIRSAINLIKAEGAGLQDVAAAIGRDVEDEHRFGAIRDADRAKFAKIIEPNIAKRSSQVFKKAYARAVEVSMQDKGELNEFSGWETKERIAVGLKLVEFMIELGLLQLEQVHPGNPKLHRTVVTLTDDVAHWLADRTQTLAQMQPAFSPMVVPPKPWTSMYSGGYWGNGTAHPRLVRRLSRVARKRYKDVDLSRVTDAINAIQNTPWQVNKQVLEVALQVSQWANPPADLASPEVNKKPVLPEGIADDPEALKAWKRGAAQVYRKETVRRSRRLAVEFQLEQAKKFSEFDRIWFPYNTDFRGRVYAIPSFCPQGTDLTKGLLLLADPVPMGADGHIWLKMHTANCYGLDKEPLDVRIKWSEDNAGDILAVAADPLGTVQYWGNADSPFCFLAACFEYANWVSQGDDYECGLPIAFDGSCSGIQHFSAMLLDEFGGAAVNLVPAERPSDIYRVVADKVIELAKRDAIHGSADTVESVTDEETGEIREVRRTGTASLAAQWLSYGITRSVTKRSVMTLPYGSKEYGFADQILADIVVPAVESKGESVFPDRIAASRYMAKKIWESLGTTVVAAVGAMSWLQKAATAVASQDMPIHWVTPVGFPVWQEYKKRPMHRIDTMICGSIRITMRVGGGQDEAVETDKAKQRSAISPNFVHSMDASHLMLTALACKEQGIEHFAMIHDSFGTCPGNAGLMFRVVREEFVRMYSEHDVIKGFYEGFCLSLTDDALEKVPELPPKGTLDLSQVVNSKYAFA